MGLHSYNWSSSEAESWGCVERRMEDEHKEKCDFPRKCYCGANPVLLTCTTKDNLGANMENVRRKYYTCKWWNDAVMEDLQEMKMEKENLEDMLQYINTRDEELKSRVDELVRLHMSREVKRSCMDVKEMKILIVIAISVALVGLVTLLFK